MHVASCIVTVLLLTPAAALGGGDLDRPPALAIEHGKAGTADASPVDPGSAELEVGYAPSWNRRGGAAGFDVGYEGHQHAGSATLTYGVAPDVDVNVGISFASIHDASARATDPFAPDSAVGLGDVALGARWRLLQLPARALEVAVLAGAVLPTGTQHGPDTLAISQEYWSARGAVVATKDLGRATANAELGLGVPLAGDAGGLRMLLRANAALGVQLASWLQPEVEVNYQSSVGASSQVLAATGGVVAPFGSGQRIVAAVQQDLWGRGTTQRTTALLAVKTSL